MEKETRSEVVVFPTVKEDPQGIFFRGEEEEEENDLSYWEFVNSSDSDDDDVLSLSDASWHSSLSSSPKDSLIPHLIQDGDDDDHHHHHLDYEPFSNGYGEPHIGDQEEDDGDGYDEEEDDYEDDGFDLDDELVPRALSGKFGRQRMRKLGKRAFAKMHTSKKSPFLYVKPGCVYGKQGLRLKHSF
ncbi:probable serine/threonine-protein kinase ifkB [Durio zibethinus]|uniref:Probable serine/threonine-protein kinase ifkB n=1 Tax=Durio zibethinus TaxID=66656 RepID=A0A6P5XBM8_DURZI|nr:probable serine/threonine-protein kinase ifkB [Durio zibethinus]